MLAEPYTHTFNVDPLGPNNLCLRLTKRSLFRVMLPILMISDEMPSSKTLTAWGKGTLLAKSLMRSLAFKMIYGSNVFFVVFTVILPSTKSKTQATPCKVIE